MQDVISETNLRFTDCFLLPQKWKLPNAPTSTTLPLTSHKVDVSNGDTIWSYQATSDGVFEGRALAIDTVGDSDGMIIVAGTTSGTSAHGSCKAPHSKHSCCSSESGSAPNIIMREIFVIACGNLARWLYHVVRYQPVETLRMSRSSLSIDRFSCEIEGRS